MKAPLPARSDPSAEPASALPARSDPSLERGPARAARRAPRLRSLGLSALLLACCLVPARGVRGDEPGGRVPAAPVTLAPRPDAPGPGATIVVDGHADLPDGATFFLELWFDGDQASRQKVRVQGGKVLARDKDEPPRFGPWQDLRLLEGSYEVVASVVPGTMSRAARAKLSTELAQTMVARARVTTFFGSEKVARDETLAARRSLRADVAALRSAAESLRDAYGSTTRTFFKPVNGKFPTDDWIRWVHEQRNDLLDPPGGSEAVKRAVGWLDSDDRFVERAASAFKEAAWRKFLDGDLRPRIKKLEANARARVEGVVMPRLPRAANDMQQAAGLLDRLTSELSHEVYRMNSLPAHANDAASRDLELVAAPATNAYGYLLQLADAVDRRVAAAEREPRKSP